jgi:hypothetical protein
MKKRICAVLLSLCSLIGVAERRSNASVIGKVLKYGSAAVGSLDTLCTLGYCYYWLKHYHSKALPEFLYVNELANDLPDFLLPEKNVNMHHLIVETLLDDLLCYGGYKLGQYLDKDKEKEKSNINSGKESSKKTVPDKDKKPTLNENSQKSKI